MVDPSASPPHSISRAEGYRRGAGKEAEGIAAVRNFLAEHADTPLADITGADDNYRYGDLRAPSGVTIEVKRQPIDPNKYQQNFVEVFEVTSNPRHSDGFQRLSALLDLAPDTLAAVRVRNQRAQPPQPSITTLGNPDSLSVSITSIFAARFTAYINPGSSQSPAHLYIYGRDEITAAIRTAVPLGLKRGAGKSNDDTFAVQIPLAHRRWTRHPGQPWAYTGTGSADYAATVLGQVLNVAA